jgi:hypothetical protein
MIKNIRSLIDPLNGTSFDIELLIAEALLPNGKSEDSCPKAKAVVILPFLQRKVPISHSTISKVFADKDIDASNNMSQHRISHQNHLFKPS